MLTVTESAKQLLRETLTAHSDDPKVALRLSFKPPGVFGIVLDREKAVPFYFYALEG